MTNPGLPFTQPERWKDQGSLDKRGSKEDLRLVTEAGEEGGPQFVMKRRPVNIRGRRPIKIVQERFHVEANVMRRLRGVSGVIPIIEVDVGSQPAWFVMEKATPLVAHLGKEPDLRVVVEAITVVAKTLARIASEHNICHRDLKPANLLWLNGPVVADFGIAEVPDRPGLTRVGEQLGPHEFLAPEMREMTPTVDGFAADIWSLAKTLFVLAGTSTDTWPPVGTLMAGRPEFSLFTAGGDAAYRLEPFLEAATAYLPQQRPSMQAFERELTAWSSSLSDDAGRRPAPRSTKSRTVSFTRENQHPDARLWAQRHLAMRKTIWRMMLALTPGALTEDGALGMLLHNHGHDEDSHLGMSGLATTVSDGGLRVVVVGFLLPDGSTAQYFAEIQQRGAARPDQFTLVETISAKGAVDWPTGQNAASEVQQKIKGRLDGHEFPDTAEQALPAWF